MSGSRWAAVVDAVVTLLDAQLSQTVFDGVPVTSDYITDAVIIGNQPGKDDGAAGLITQDYHEVGVGAKRDEKGEIRCAAMSQTGDDTLASAKDIKGELLMFWGKQDPHVPLEGRKKIYNALCELNVNFTWHEFNGQHAFIRDEGHRYDPALALQCYQMALELFHRRLSEGDLPVAPSGPAESKH